MYTGCNLKTTEFHECALIGVCAVIRSNTVYIFFLFFSERRRLEADNSHEKSSFIFSEKKNKINKMPSDTVVTDALMVKI